MSIEGVKKAKEYRNVAERAFSEGARAKGWQVTKRGYPDFICYLPDGGLVLVEVKTKSTHKLHKNQWRLMNVLKNNGIRCYKWSPDRNWMSSGESAKEATEEPETKYYRRKSYNRWELVSKT